MDIEPDDILGYEDDEDCDCPECQEFYEPESTLEFVPYVTWRLPR